MIPEDTARWEPPIAFPHIQSREFTWYCRDCMAWGDGGSREKMEYEARKHLVDKHSGEDAIVDVAYKIKKVR